MLYVPAVSPHQCNLEDGRSFQPGEQFDHVMDGGQVVVCTCPEKVANLEAKKVDVTCAFKQDPDEREWRAGPGFFQAVSTGHPHINTFDQSVVAKDLLQIESSNLPELDCFTFLSVCNYHMKVVHSCCVQQVNTRADCRMVGK